jgi:ubiquinone/menaquinone biosynthesis C-methylase UbiE
MNIVQSPRKFYFYGFLCRVCAEPFMNATKRKVAFLFKKANISPVLDICSGGGGQCRHLEKAALHPYGIDINWNLLSSASRTGAKAGFICADAGCVPLRDSSFQGISLVFALHDKSPQLRQKMLSEVKRLLKPGGKAIFADYVHPWNFWSGIGSLFTYIIELFSGHYSNGMDFLSQGGLAAVLEKNGFIELERTSLSWKRSAIITAELSRTMQ